MPALAPVVKLLEEHQRFVILCHADPDGDAFGSALALKTGLRSLGKEAEVVSRDAPAPPFRFLPGIDTIQSDFLLGDYEVLVVVDCADLARSGFGERIVQARRRGKPILNIDHHPRNGLTRVASVNLVDEVSAASSQIVAGLLAALRIRVTPDIATQLLTGLYTDTGGFKHSNTTPPVLELASNLLSRGARLKRIVRNLAVTRSFTALRAWGVALSRVRRHPHLPLSISVVTREDLTQCAAVVEDLGGVVNVINSIPGTKAAVLFTELPDGEIKVSLRTESEAVDTSRIATIFGGGGHKKASGFRLKGRVVNDGETWQIIPEGASS